LMYFLFGTATGNPFSAFLSCCPCANPVLEGKIVLQPLPPKIFIRQDFPLSFVTQAMYFLRAATSIIISTTVIVPTQIYITSSAPVTSYYTTSTVQLIPTTIVTSLPVTQLTSIPTLVHAPVTITLSTDIPHVPTTTSILLLDYNPPPCTMADL